MTASFSQLLSSTCMLVIGLFVVQAVLEDWKEKPSALSGMKRSKTFDFVLLAVGATVTVFGLALLWFATRGMPIWGEIARFSWPIFFATLVISAFLLKRSPLFWLPLTLALIGLWVLAFVFWGPSYG